MNDSGNDWLALLALAFTMGLRHGLDADHLVAIDGLARYQASSSAHSERARWCGLAFSAGHGAIVTIVAVLVGALSSSFVVPRWIEGLGATISIGALSALGVLNLRAVLATPRHEHVRLVGLRAGWLGRLSHSGHPVAPALVGALFALSFDTMSLASLFALTASRFGGASRALALGVVFGLGMVVVDAANGVWVARLLERADERALRASRWMGAVVALLSLLVAGLGVAKVLLPGVASWSEGRELGFSLAIVVLLGLAFLVTTRLPRAAPISVRAGFGSRAEPPASTGE